MIRATGRFIHYTPEALGGIVAFLWWFGRGFTFELLAVCVLL